MGLHQLVGRDALHPSVYVQELRHGLHLPAVPEPYGRPPFPSFMLPLPTHPVDPKPRGPSSSYEIQPYQIQPHWHGLPD